MNDFKAGYARVNINPPLGSALFGYYVKRLAKGYLDDLEAFALALTKGEKKFLVISIDNCSVNKALVDACTEVIFKATGIPRENILISATHTHTGPFSSKPGGFAAGENEEEIVMRYIEFLKERIKDLAVLAMQTLKPAKMGYAIGHAPDRIAYIRRYKMKDGSTQTCPPVNDPNIDHPIGTLDQRVNVIRFDREGAESVVILNYGIHADTVNGDMVSSDWCGWTRRTLEKVLDGTKCLCIMGAQGDVGSTNVHPLPGDMNDTEISFDNEMKSPGMARFVGRALAGTVLQVFDKVAYIDVDDIDVIHRSISIPANNPTPEEMPAARKIKELHDAGRDDLIPFEAMELTTVVAEANRMIRLEKGPYEFPAELMGLGIGKLVLTTIPGEPFTNIGERIKEIPGWEIVVPCAIANGSMGYFPNNSAYDEGGYETRASSYKRGVADVLVNESAAMLNELKERI